MSEQLGQPQLDQVSSSELAERIGFETQLRPIEALPEVATDVIPGQEFWSRRVLRPNEPGPNFHNLPALKLGVSYEDDQAILTVPTLEHINQFVDKHNPGGFRFMNTGSGLVADTEFLHAIAEGTFLVSSDKTSAVTINDWGDKYHSLSDRPRTFQSNYYEHDHVEHLGLAAIDATEAHKLVELAASLSNLSQSEHYISSEVRQLDTLLGYLSDYALLPVEPITELDTMLKEKLKRSIRHSVKDLVHPIIVKTFVPNEEEDPGADIERFDAEKDALIDKYCPNFEVLDRTLSHFQTLPAS
jgi:hypothetical protein